MVGFEFDVWDEGLGHCERAALVLRLPRNEFEAVFVADVFSFGKLIPSTDEVIRHTDQLISDLESAGWVNTFNSLRLISVLFTLSHRLDLLDLYRLALWRASAGSGLLLLARTTTTAITKNMENASKCTEHFLFISGKD